MLSPIIDPKIKRHLRRYTFQASIATLALLATLWEQIVDGGDVACTVLLGGDRAVPALRRQLER